MTQHARLASSDPVSTALVVVYGHPGSSCTQRVLLTLAEKEVEPAFVLVDLARGDHKAPEHLRRQPFGVVPAIEIDGFVLYESRAIMRYLDHRFPQNPLTPADHAARALMEQFLSVEYSYLASGVGSLMAQKVLRPMRGLPADSEAVAKARGEVARTFDVLDAQLAGHAYLAGEAFSLAEVSMLPSLGALGHAQEQDLIAERPNLAAWAGRITARPAWQKVVARASR